MDSAQLPFYQFKHPVTNDIESLILDIGQRARIASRALSLLSTDAKNTVLLAMADALVTNATTILTANASDVDAAQANGLTAASIDRLRLNPERIEAMARGIREVAALPDPVNECLSEWTRPNGIRISKIRKPIGVIGIIYESRPNVTSDAAVLCIKTGNAVILRGGSESIESNKAIAEALQSGGEKAGLPYDAIQLVPIVDREAVRCMAAMDSYIDLIVPRGGRGLIEAVMKHARMPVIKHLDGICHIYVDADAEPSMAADIVFNAKVQRPSACNAVETLLIHESIAPTVLPVIAASLAPAQVELRADDRALTILRQSGYTHAKAAEMADWTTEHLDLVLGVRVVDGLTLAIDHIETFGSHHSDAIVTENAQTAEKFLQAVDSATVYWNASTRFTDGGEFGFGAEIGISTDKLHARGPMALAELTTYRYLIRGEGQVRQ